MRIISRHWNRTTTLRLDIWRQNLVCVGSEERLFSFSKPKGKSNHSKYLNLNNHARAVWVTDWLTNMIGEVNRKVSHKTPTIQTLPTLTPMAD